jgi:predicted nucleotidyltransferase
MEVTPVEKALVRLEKDHDIEIVIAAEVGSKRWGLDSLSSDNDIAFIYVHHDRKKYLSIGQHADTHKYKDVEHNIEFSGWDIRHALRALRAYNASVMELLHSNIFYRKEEVFYKFFVGFDSAKAAYNSMRMFYRSAAQAIMSRTVEKLLDLEPKAALKDFVLAARYDILYLNLITHGTYHGATESITSIAQVLDDPRLVSWTFPRNVLRDAIDRKRKQNYPTKEELIDIVDAIKNLHTKINTNYNLAPVCRRDIEEIDTKILDAFFIGHVFHSD